MPVSAARRPTHVWLLYAAKKMNAHAVLLNMLFFGDGPSRNYLLWITCLPETCQARWALTSEKAANRAERGRRFEAEVNEMELANIELVARRSARLKDLYQHLNDR